MKQFRMHYRGGPILCFQPAMKPDGRNSVEGKSESQDSTYYPEKYPGPRGPAAVG